jgi:putative transposase
MASIAELEISLRHRLGEIYSVDMRYRPRDSDAEEAPLKNPLELQFYPEKLRALNDDPAEYGRCLTGMLFPDDKQEVITALNSVRANVGGAELRVRLYLDPNAIALHEFRWESLRDLANDAPLFTSENLWCSRYLSSSDWRPAKPRSKGELRALVAIASPTNIAAYGTLDPVDSAGELARAKKALGEDIQVEELVDHRATLKNIVTRLREGIDILYLVCHGTLKKGSWLWLEADDESGTATRVSGSDFATRVRELAHRPYLVVLASCESAGLGGVEARTADYDGVGTRDVGSYSALLLTGYWCTGRMRPMPRQARLDMPGALHHIMVRGINKSSIFKDNQDRARFVGRLGETVSASHGSVYAWVLMRDHVHILFKSGSEGISWVMRRLLTWYGQYFNRRHKRSGHLFENRYKSILCEEETYLLALVRYIHLNPIRAKVVQSLEGLDRYRWSGHRAIIGKAKCPWMDIDTVLSQYGGRRKEAISAYRRFVGEGMAEGRNPRLVGGGLIRSQGGWSQVVALRRRGNEEESDERILGSGDFVHGVLQEAEERHLRQIKFRRLGRSITHIIQEECETRGISPEELKGGSRRVPVSEVRGAIACRIWG